MEALFYVNEEVKKKPVIIFGTGDMGKACLNELTNSGVNVECFCSDILEERGKVIQGKRVITLEEMVLMENYNIVITVENYKSVLTKLKGKAEQNVFMYRNVYDICLM